MNQSKETETLKVSSPVEANIPNQICFDIQALDVGFENPVFVALEVEYGNLDDKMATVNTGIVKKKLNLYEMNLGINNMVLMKTIETERSAYKIITHLTEKENKQFQVISNHQILSYNYKGEIMHTLKMPQRIEFLEEDSV